MTVPKLSNSTISNKTEYTITFGDDVWTVLLKEKATSVKITLSVRYCGMTDGYSTLTANTFEEAIVYAWKKARYESNKRERDRKRAYAVVRSWRGNRDLE